MTKAVQTLINNKTTRTTMNDQGSANTYNKTTRTTMNDQGSANTYNKTSSTTMNDQGSANTFIIKRYFNCTRNRPTFKIVAEINIGLTNLAENI